MKPLAVGLWVTLACAGLPMRGAPAADTNITIDPAIAKASAEADAGTAASPETAATPDNPRTPYDKALYNYKAGKYEAARVMIDEADQQNPGNVPIEMLRVRILGELHEFHAAHQALNSLYDRSDLTPAYAAALMLTTGDLNLRERHFDEASKAYEQFLQGQPADPDAKLKLIYASLGTSNLVKAGKLASELKAMDATSPAYYFAHAALAHAGAENGDEEQDLQQARTIYGITVTNRYLKTYLEVFAGDKNVPSKPGGPKPAPSGKAQ